MKKGSITIFLALAVPLVVLLLFMVVESARYTGLRAVQKSVGNNALDSMFASYNRTLFDEYGVVFLDGSADGGLLDCGTLERSFQDAYFSNAVSPVAEFMLGSSFFSASGMTPEVTNVVTATDYNGEVFIRSVVDYYKYDLVGSVFETVKEKLNLISQGDSAKSAADQDTNALQSTDWSQYSLGGGELPRPIQYAPEEPEPGTPGSGDPENDGEDAEEAGEDVPPQGEIQGGGGGGSASFGDEEEEPEPIDDRKLKGDIENSAIGSAQASKAKGWLALVTPANTSVSGYTMDQADAPSLSAVDERRIESGGFLGELAEGLGFYEYILDRFSCYTHQTRQSGMIYDVEYALYGHASDVKNFETALNRIMWIREGMNMLYLIASDHRTEANAVAETLVGWTGNQLIVMLTAAALMAAWAYAESILDVRALLQGKRVAFFKSEESWVLSIQGIENLLCGGGEAAKEDTFGMTYEDYLRVLLYASNESKTAYRVMDLIQDRLRQRTPNFFMAAQVYALEIRADIVATGFFSALPVVKKRTGKDAWYVFSERFTEVY